MSPKKELISASLLIAMKQRLDLSSMFFNQLNFQIYCLELLFEFYLYQVMYPIRLKEVKKVTAKKSLLKQCEPSPWKFLCHYMISSTFQRLWRKFVEQLNNVALTVNKLSQSWSHWLLKVVDWFLTWILAGCGGTRPVLHPSRSNCSNWWNPVSGRRNNDRKSSHVSERLPLRCKCKVRCSQHCLYLNCQQVNRWRWFFCSDAQGLRSHLY